MEVRSNRLLILIAYACEPDKGSEPGAGWEFLRQGLHHFEKVLLLTKENNISPIYAALSPGDRARVRIPNLRLTRLAEQAKRKQFLVRPYYLLWQLRVGRYLREHANDFHDAVVHHATFATVVLPPISILSVPQNCTKFVGPVGGFVRINWKVAFRILSPVDLLREIVREAVRLIALNSPVHSYVYRRSGTVICQSAEGAERLRSIGCKVKVMSNSAPPPTVTSSNSRSIGRAGSKLEIVYAGRLLGFKGVETLLHALTNLPTMWHLHVVGSGSNYRRLRRVASNLKIDGMITWHGQLSRLETIDVIRRANVFALPSLRDEGPAVIAEAHGLGKPVAAFDVGAIRQLLESQEVGPIRSDLSWPESIAALREGVLALQNVHVSVPNVETWEDKGRRIYRVWSDLR